MVNLKEKKYFIPAIAGFTGSPSNHATHKAYVTVCLNIVAASRFILYFKSKNMRILSLATLFILGCLTARSQYKFDNKLFQTIYIEDLCDELNANPDHLILDVRSLGEFMDTSQYSGLNIGHLKGAQNINIRELDARWKELLPYKDKPIFVYCSHSQRSRRASRLLADSGFTKVININGGLSNAPLLRDAHPECFAGLYETTNPYKILSAREAALLLTEKKDVQIIDIRSDSAFRGISSNEIQNAAGAIKNAVNIPKDLLEKTASKFSKSKPVLLIDDYGNDSPLAAELLVKKGFKQVSILFDGMDGWMNADRINAPEINAWSVHRIPYYLLSARDFAKAMGASERELKVIDIRTKEEFQNTYKDSWRNVGHVRNAVNKPISELEANSGDLDSYKNKMIVIYGFSGQPEIFETARTLASKGFKNVNVLLGGIWNLRWRAANIKGLANLRYLVVDVPEENL